MGKEKNDIETREDIYIVVKEFYSKVRIDSLLGPIFNSIIKDWDHHFIHLTDFWESNVFMITKYSGNPIVVHQQVDKETAHKIDQSYFVQWLKLWFSTIDEFYEGDKANIMKNRARNMSTYIFIQMANKRNESK